MYRRTASMTMAICVAALLSEAAATANAETITVNFDSIDALASGTTGVTGQVLTNYLGGYGISVSGDPVRVLDTRNYPGLMVPSSFPNVFTGAGGNTESFTLHFAVPLESLEFTRIRFNVTDPSLGTTSPEWTAKAFDAHGNLIASVGEPLLASFQDILAQQFTLSGPGIASVEIDSDAMHFAGFGAPMLDDFILETPEPASLTLLAIGIAGMAGYGWRRRKLAAA
jgi:hypothetical protein